MSQQSERGSKRDRSEELLKKLFSGFFSEEVSVCLINESAEEKKFLGEQYLLFRLVESDRSGEPLGSVHIKIYPWTNLHSQNEEVREEDSAAYYDWYIDVALSFSRFPGLEILSQKGEWKQQETLSFQRHSYIVRPCAHSSLERGLLLVCEEAWKDASESLSMKPSVNDELSPCNQNLEIIENANVVDNQGFKSLTHEGSITIRSVPVIEKEWPVSLVFGGIPLTESQVANLRAGDEFLLPLQGALYAELRLAGCPYAPVLIQQGSQGLRGQILKYEKEQGECPVLHLRKSQGKRVGTV